MAILKQFDFTIANFGNAEPILAGSELADVVILRPRSTNTSTIFVGTEDVVRANEIGILATATAPYVINPSAISGQSERINLGAIHVDGGTNGDIVHVQYLVADI